MRALVASIAGVALACASAPSGAAPDPPADATLGPPSATDLPVGFGTLRQEDLSLLIQLPGGDGARASAR